jgi:hypothetical protein
MVRTTNSKNQDHSTCEGDEMRSRMRQSRTSGSAGSGEEQSRRLPNNQSKIGCKPLKIEQLNERTESKGLELPRLTASVRSKL